jgi:chromosome segregation ATPase
MSEEQWNSKLAEKKMLIAFLATELGLVKEKVQNLQSQLEAAEVVHIVLLKCMENECTLKFKALQAKLTDSKNQCATLREMVSHKDCELQDVLEHLVAVKSSYDRSKTERDQYENQCATLREDISRKHLELQDLREDLVAFKSSYDRTKVKRDEYEDAQLVLQEKVQKLEQCNKRLEEMVCRDESHLMLLHEKDCLEAQLTTLKETHRKALSEKLELQIGHDSLIETLEQQTRRLEEEKKKLERIQRKQEKHFRDRCGKLIQGEVELKEGVQTLEVEKARFQERTKLYEAVKMSQKFEMEQERDELKRELEKLKQVHAKTLEELENCHMRLKEIEAELRKKDTECQTTSKAAAELRKMYAECQTTSEKLTKTQRSGEPLEGAYKNVKVSLLLVT